MTGTWRLSLGALVVVSVATAMRHWETSDWWWLGGGAVALLLLFGRWHGLFVTTIARRYIGLVARNRGRQRRRPPSAAETTVVLHIAAEPDRLPLHTVAGYLHRYGIRCAAVRVIRVQAADSRDTWLGLTIRAAVNLAALRARSPELPLAETAAVMRRRLADELREHGLAVDLVDMVAGPLPDTWSKERWRGVQTDTGFVAAYRVTVDEALSQRLHDVSALPATQIWTVLELTGDPARPTVTAAAALVTAERPTGKPPLAGVLPRAGRHRPALEAMVPVPPDARKRAGLSDDTPQFARHSLVHGKA